MCKDLNETSIRAFKNTASALARSMHGTRSAKQKRICNIQFGGRQVRVPVHDLNTEWYNRFSARLKSALMGHDDTGIPMMPFESWILTASAAPIKVPDDIITPMRQARQMACELITEAGCSNVDEMITTLIKEEEVLKQADHSFVLELAWMRGGGVQESMTDVTEEKILASFPSEETEITLKQAISHLESMQVSDFGTHNTAGNKATVRAVLDMLNKIQRGVPPSRNFDEAGKLWRSIHARMQYFMRGDVAQIGKKGSNKKVFGAEAPTYS